MLRRTFDIRIEIEAGNTQQAKLCVESLPDALKEYKEFFELQHKNNKILIYPIVYKTSVGIPTFQGTEAEVTFMAMMEGMGAKFIDVK